jgi:hypothetical protein
MIRGTLYPTCSRLDAGFSTRADSLHLAKLGVVQVNCRGRWSRLGSWGGAFFFFLFLARAAAASAVGSLASYRVWHPACVPRGRELCPLVCSSSHTPWPFRVPSPVWGWGVAVGWGEAEEEG